MAAVEEATGCREFVYVTAVTSLRGDRTLWEDHEPFREALAGNRIRLITMRDMVSEVLSKLGTTVAPSQLARTLQLLKASGVSIHDSKGVPLWVDTRKSRRS